MAGKKISELSSASALIGGELFPAIQSGVNAKVTADQIKTFASGGELYTRTTLTPAEVVTIHSSPVELVPAPGAGKVIEISSIAVFGSAGICPIGDIGASLHIIYQGNTGSLDLNISAALLASQGPFSVMAGVSGFTELSPENRALIVYADADLTLWGAISSTSLNNGGTGYVVGDTGYIFGDGSTDALFQIDTVDGGGAVLTYHLTDFGTAYRGNNSNADTGPAGAQPTSGTGFQIAVTVITPGNPGLTIDTWYRVVDYPYS